MAVDSGTFYRTYANDGGGPTGEFDPATVSAFRLDKYDVTVGRFRQFAGAVLPSDGGVGWMPDAGAGKHSHLHGGMGLLNSTPDGGVTYESGWDPANNGSVAPTTNNLTTACDHPPFATWTDTPGSNENKPINCITYYEAQAFCIWDGGFLPSEAEWAYAAAGGTLQREYPWGSTDPGQANQYAIYNCYYDTDAGCSTQENIAPVGTPALGAGLWGQLDLAGNAWQVVLDFWDGTSPYNNPCVDCASLTPQSQVVLRGGNYADSAMLLSPSFRGSNAVVYRTRGLTFRCARTP